MLYQIVYLNRETTEEGKTTLTIDRTDLLEAVDLRTAYATIDPTAPADDEEEETTATFRILPYATATDGEGQLALARYAFRTFEKWETRNEYAVLNPTHRTPEEREDLTATACLSIVDSLSKNPAVDMFTLSKVAFSAIATEQKRKDRNSEREYHPDWKQDNLKPLLIKSTFPALDRLIRKAVETADLTEGQKAYFNMVYTERMEISAIAESENINKRRVYKNLYKAYYKILETAVSLDPDLRTFRKAGYTPADVAETVEKFRKRAYQ